MAHSVKEVISAFIKLRDQRDELKRKHKDELKPFNEKLDSLGNWLLGELNKQESDSVSVKGVGTAFTSVRTSSKVQDWDETLPFILENDLTHMLERRVSKTALEEYIEANGETIPGVSISREVIINVRRKD